jgi:hypothetical protein
VCFTHILQEHVPKISSIFSLMLQVFYVVWPGASGRARGVLGAQPIGALGPGDGVAASQDVLGACSFAHLGSHVLPTQRVIERRGSGEGPIGAETGAECTLVGRAKADRGRGEGERGQATRASGHARPSGVRALAMPINRSLGTDGCGQLPLKFKSNCL